MLLKAISDRHIFRRDTYSCYRDVVLALCVCSLFIVPQLVNDETASMMFPRILFGGILFLYYTEIRMSSFIEVLALGGDKLTARMFGHNSIFDIDMRTFGKYRCKCSSLILESKFGNRFLLEFRTPEAYAKASEEIARLFSNDCISSSKCGHVGHISPPKEILSAVVCLSCLVCIAFLGIGLLQAHAATRFESELGVMIGLLLIFDSIPMPFFHGLLLRILSIVKPSFFALTLLRTILFSAGLLFIFSSI